MHAESGAFALTGDRIGCRRRDHPGSSLLAGGTDWLVNMRHGMQTPSLMTDPSACVRVAEIESRLFLAQLYRALQQAAQWRRRSNGHCLKERVEICHLVPKGRRCRAVAETEGVS